MGIWEGGGKLLLVMFFYMFSFYYFLADYKYTIKPKYLLYIFFTYKIAVYAKVSKSTQLNCC